MSSSNDKNNLIADIKKKKILIKFLIELKLLKIN